MSRCVSPGDSWTRSIFSTLPHCDQRQNCSRRVETRRDSDASSMLRKFAVVVAVATAYLLSLLLSLYKKKPSQQLHHHHHHDHPLLQAPLHRRLRPRRRLRRRPRQAQDRVLAARQHREAGRVGRARLFRDGAAARVPEPCLGPGAGEDRGVQRCCCCSCCARFRRCSSNPPAPREEGLKKKERNREKEREFLRSF